MDTATLVTFIVYLAGMLAIGIIGYRMTSNLSDYFLGGRRLGPGVAALSAGASDMSGWLLLGLPGTLFASGFSGAWIAVGLSIGAYLNWQFVAKRLRIYTEVSNDSITVPDFFENRFRDHSHVLRLVSALVILIFFTVYTASGMAAGAKLFNSAFDLTYTQGLWLGAVVIIAYTFLGGFIAVSWTDFFQGILMFFALIILPVIAINELGGWSETMSIVSDLSPGHLEMVAGVGVIGILSSLGWGLGYFGMPHIIVRFMGMKSHRDTGKARFIGITWMVLGLYGAIFTGVAGYAYLNSVDTGIDLANFDSETIFIVLSQMLTHPIIAGILLAAILSAVMSTIDSQLLVSSSAVAEDFYKGLIRKDATDKELVVVARVSVLVIALIAIFMAYDPNSSVFGLVSYAWAGFGAAFGPIVILSLFWKGITRNGAIAGMIVGAVTVVVWHNLSGGLFDLYEIFPGFVLNFIVAVLVSMTGEGPSQEIQDEFEQARQIAEGR
ncbi:MAG: sodium/proline symporter PutP [Bacillaceae bacterium]|nr:sodium/proline symporter PutP [Bacillaceae bacterium]